MSFILDALRKSELERQQEAVPRAMRIPLARPESRVPAWALAVMIALAAGVLMLAAAWWRLPGPGGAATEAAGAAATRAEGTAAMAAENSAAPADGPDASATLAAGARTARARTARETPPPERAGAPPRALAPEARPAVEPAAGVRPSVDATADVRPAVEPAAPAPAAPSRAELPTAGELRAEGVTLAALRLELHVYGDTPAERFVFINGARYAEGERLDDGPLLVAITRDGAVLSQDDRDFFLPIE